MEKKKKTLDDRAEELKGILKALIKAGRTREGLILLENNWHLFPADVEIYSIAGVIYSYQMRIKEAKEIILKGLKHDPNNFDLLYNIGYICELQEDYFNAWNYYQKAKKNIETPDQSEDLDLAMKTLGKKIKNRK